MSGEKRSWLDIEIFKIPTDETGNKLLIGACTMLLDAGKNMHAYRELLSDVVPIEMDAGGAVLRNAVLTSILIARSSGGNSVELRFDGYENFYSIDECEGKRRYMYVGELDMLESKFALHSFQSIFNEFNPTSSITLRGLIDGLEALDTRLRELAKNGQESLAEFKSILSKY